MSYENICNICGANYEYVNGRWVCPACGAYKAEELSNEEVTLLYNAAQKLRLADFDDAEQAYADIVQKYPFNHEGYWGRLLSKYGIKYEEDFDGKKIPTCYATTIESILGDSDYKRATELAPPDVREYYARQAEYIERVRKEWVDKASHEAPYDVFICYKDSDLANGIDRTQDSIAAQELYIHLMEQGYRVFFSRESLRDKVGEKYEPYIFNALSTAKVMLVYGTNPEFITSTWLKNEWTRYHKRILAGDKKQGSLVTICDGFAPSELPRLLSATQCFDATKRSFYSDLDKYVKKYTKEDEPAPVAVPAPEGEAAGDAAVQEAPVAVEKKKLSRGKKTAIGVAAAAVLIAVLMVIFIPVLTADPALDNFEIREGAGGMTYISGYVGDGKKVVIPEKFNGGTVVGIEARAFDSMDTLTSITIPDSVTSIGANAFYGCTSVDTIVIPSSVTSMGMSAFYGWTNKQTVIIQGKETAPSGWNDKWLEGCDAKIVYSKITVGFDANGGRGKAINIKSEIDSKMTLPDGKDFTRAGYTFAGWTLDEKGTKADFKAGDVYKIGKEQGLIFYAVWSPNKNKVIFDANGGKGSMNPIEGYTDSRVELPTATFTRDGYNFIGWATASGASSPKYSVGAYYTFGTANSTVLYAVWEAMPRNIYLYPNGGVGDVQTYYDMQVGHILFLDKGYFTRQGYTFAGYAESPDGPLMYPNGSDYTVPEGQGDITLYAFWEPRNYPLRFHSNDENGKTVTVQVGFETTIDLPDPGFSREGYKLIGWSTNNKVENMTVEYEVNGKYTHQNMGTFSLYAVWAPMEYNVNFYANHPNAGGVMNSIQIALGSEAKLPACTFIYDGHMLAGWATAPDGEAVYDPEGLFKMTTSGDKVLYAVWKEMEYSIRYELGNHGVNHAENPKVYRASDGAITLQAPTREGYEFLGWFSDAEMTVPCDTIAADSIGEVTFWAKWHALPNTVIFDANGGEGSMSSVTADTDTVITLPLNTMTREDCTFMGWTTVLGGTEVEYADGAEFTMQSHGVTLYAVWKAQSYTISYDFAGGELPGAVTEYSHLTNSFTLGVPTREGYEFVGWSGTGIEGIQRTVMISIGSKGDRSYTANWQATTHNIVFIQTYYWIEGTMDAIPAKTGETVTLPKNTFVNYGYVFKGWSTTRGGKVEYTEGQTIVMGTDHLGLYSIWELQSPGLTFDAENVTGYTGNSAEVIIPAYYNGHLIRNIAAGAFRDKTHITSIILPNDIIEIGENAFAGCTSLANIEFAGTVHHVPLSAFMNTAYYNDPANRVNGVFYFEGHLIAPIDLTISGNYVVPSGTKVIVADAFKNCASLVTVFIPSSVEYIGENAFESCTSLTIRCEVSECPTNWDWNWNTNNRPIVWSYHEEYTDANGIKYQLYPDMSAIVVGYTGSATELTLLLPGYTVKKIANNAFQNNGTLTKVIFAEGLVEIGTNAFSGCYNLVEIVLPEGLERIGENAFNECQRLTTVTATGDAANGAKGLTVTPIKTFPSSLIYIGQYAFSKCDSLKLVFVPASIKTVAYGAFAWSNNLVVYAQPDAQPAEWEWFEATTVWGIDNIYSDAQDLLYALYADGTAKVVDYLGTAESIIIALQGYTVTEIGERAFYSCDTLKTVVLPSTLKVIGRYAFSGCRALKRVEIPEGVTEIAQGAFNGCNVLEELVLPSTLTQIGESAFSYCHKLTELSLPSGLLSIGTNAFIGCDSLTSVFLPASIEKMGEFVFSGTSSFVIYASMQSQPGAWNLKWNQSGFGAYGEIYYYPVVWNYKAHLTADNGVTYILTNDNKAYVVSYEGTATELDLTLDGYTVVAIEPYAFDGCTTLQKIVLPEGLVTIGAYAFTNCTALTDVKLPSTLTTICDHAFNNCQGLKVIDISAGVTSVEEYAFWNCNNLTVYAGAASKPDGWSASWNNENRPVVWNVKEHLTADNGVIYIIRNDNTVVVSGYTGEPTELDLSLEGYTVTEIAARAFYDCDTLTKVTMPDTITKIGESAFYHCGNLVSVKLSTGVTVISESAFSICSNLSDITLHEGLLEIDSFAFNQCWALVTLNLPNTLTTIASAAFQECTALKIIMIPASVNYVGDSAFWNCTNLSIYAMAEYQPNTWGASWNPMACPVTWGVAGVHFDNQGVTYVLNNDKTATVVKYTGDAAEITLSVEGYTVTKIADNVFENNEKLKRVILLDGMLEIGYRAFYDSDIESITIPNSVTTIGAQAFANCQKLSNAKLPANLTSLGYEAFYCCESLTEINIPKGLAKLESMVFYCCSKVTAVTVEDGSYLSEIGNQAFAGCVRLESINLPTTLKTIGENAFNDCNRLISIVIPEGVTSIGNYAFNSCELLESVTLPSTLTSIGEWAFQSCSALKSISIPAGVETIGEGAFSSCSVLSSLEIAEGVKHIGKDAFRYCHALRSVVLPNSILTIGEYAFSDSNNLNTVFIPASVTEIDQYAFYGNGSLTIYVSAASEPATWDSFWNYGDRPVVWGVVGIVTDAQGVVYRLMNDKTAIVIGFTDKGVTDLVIGLEGYTVTGIGARAFYQCASLTSVTFPSTLVSIGDYAFASCTKLTGVIFPESLTTIGERAFEDMKAMRTVYIPATVTTIGYGAFSNRDYVINIYCEQESKPSGWHNSWWINSSRVTWNADGVYTDDQGLIYQLFDADKTAKLVGFTTAKETYVIPAAVNGYNVTAIASYIFEGKADVTRLIIPANVTVIASGAFQGCPKLVILTELTSKPAGWEDGWYSNILGVAWGTDKVHVNDQGVAYALYSDNTAKVIGCPDDLTSVTISATVEGCKVTEIADRAFQNRSMLTSITLPNGLLKIGNYAFASVHSLSGITLPDTLTHIGEFAFGYCNNVQKTIFIPASVTTIEANAFDNGCFSWIYTAHKSKPDGWNDYWNCTGYSVAWDYAGFVTDSQGVTYLLHPDKTASVYSYSGNATELTFFVEGYSVVEICAEVFRDHGEITKVTFPSTLKKIGNSAFYNCSALTSIELPDGIEMIGDFAFVWCSGVISKELTIPAGVDYIGDEPFGSTGITTIYVMSPENSNWHGKWHGTIYDVYWNYKDTYTDAQGVTYILHNDNTATVWSYNGNATTLSFAVEGYTVTKIRARTFENNTTLTSVTLPEGLLEIGDYAFAQCSKLQCITIPAGVTRIGSHVFYFCSNLQSVTLPEGIVEIGDRAFHECSKLQTINLPEGLTVIRESAFYWCTNLQSIVLPDSLTTIETFAFYNTGLTSLIIPANVTTIGHAAFHSITADKIYVKRAEATENYDYSWHNRGTDDIIWNFKEFYTDTQGITYALFNDNTAHAIERTGNATEITFAVEGYTVTRIKRDLLSTSGANNITKVTLLDGLLVIEDYALSGLTSVKELYIPLSVTTIGYNAIRLADGATIYTAIAERPTGWNDQWTSNNVGAYGPIYNHQVVWNFKSIYVDTTYGITYVLRNDNTAIAVAFDGTVTEVVIGVDGYTVTALGKELFKNRTTLTKVTLPEGLTEIGDFAFYGCQRLNTLSLPTTIKTVGNSAFTDCFGIVSISFSTGLTKIGSSAFSNCTGLTSITLPDSVTTIGEYAFQGCIKLASIDLPEGVTSISGRCFENCTALVSVTLPSGLKAIQDFAFNGCTKLKQIDLPTGLMSMGDYAFQNCDALTQIKIPEGITEIARYLFENCDSLQTVIFPTTLKKIGEDAFNNCLMLENVILPNGLTEIGGYAFYNCQKLESIIIPEGVTTMGWGAFWNSGDLTVFSRSYARPTGWNTEWVSTSTTVVWNFKELVVKDDLTYAVRNDGTAVVIEYSGTAEELTIGLEEYSVAEIGGYVFKDNTTLKKVVLPEGLKKIGAHAFDGCTKLSSINLPDGLTAIDDYAFYNCDALTEVNIPEGVTELSYRVFCDCEALKTVILPSTLITIRSYAFGSCINLSSIIIPESVTTVESEAFSNCQTITAFVRSLAKPSGWSSSWIDSSRPVIWDFKELVVKDGVTYAVRNDGTAVVLSYSGTAEELTLGIEGVTVTEIARKAFYDNDTLKKIVIPEGVEVIGAYAFYSCSNLKEVSLPLTLKTIGNEAFAYSAIEQLVLKEHLIEIGDSTFSGCNLLIGVILPDGLQSLGSWAFSSCESLKYVFIPDTVTTMQEYAFGNDYNLTIYVEAVSQPSTWNTYWNGHNATVVYGVKGMKMDEQGVIYQLLEDNKASVVGFRFNGTDTDIVIGLDGYTVISIGRYAFSESSITSVVIPEGVETISSYAFYNCNALKSIQLPSTLRTIEGNAFENISNELTTLYIPANVTTIGFFAFTNFGHEITVYAEAVSKPDGWVESWCPSLKEIVWGYVPTSEEQA